MDMSALRPASQQSTHKNTSEIKTTTIDSHENSDLPLNPMEAGETSDEEDGFGQQQHSESAFSGANTPKPFEITGIRVQRGTNAVIDGNGLGWPGVSVIFAFRGSL